jgi:hypothetical protein
MCYIALKLLQNVVFLFVMQKKKLEILKYKYCILYKTNITDFTYLIPEAECKIFLPDIDNPVQLHMIPTPITESSLW